MTKEVTNEDLAIMVKKGFDGVDKRFEQVDQRFEQVDKRFEQVDQRFEQIDKRLDKMDDRFDGVDRRLAVIETDVSEIRKHFIYRDEFDDLMARVKYIEFKMGIESGV